MRELTRRAALAAGAGLALAPAALASTPEERRDAVAVTRLRDAERVAHDAYAAALTLPLASGRRRLLERIRDQKRAHVAALAEILAGLGAEPPPRHPPPPPAPPGKGDLLHGLPDLEARLLALYRDALNGTSSAGLASRLAPIMASDAQHQSVLRLELGTEPIPTAFAPAP